MNRVMLCALLAGAVLWLSGCATPIPPGAERGPHGTMAYTVLVDASAPGARIVVNGQDVGNTPVRIKVFGDPDGTFHDFGSPYFVISASPLTTNQFAQVRYFGTGYMFGPEDHVPSQVYFDMNRPPAAPPYPPPAYYYGPPPYYYGPTYGGPAVRFYIGPGYYHRHW